METSPRRVVPLTILSCVCLSFLAGALIGIVRLAQAELSLSLLLWFFLPLQGIPVAALVGYWIYGLATARYALNREGFALRWGQAYEQVPLEGVRSLTRVSELGEGLQLPVLARLFGTAGRAIEIPGYGPAEVFAIGDAQGGLLVNLGQKVLLITPPSSEEFLEAFRSSTRQGSLEDLPAQSWRPDLVIGAVWRDRAARLLLLLGWVLPVGMVVYLSVNTRAIPGEVPFGFDAGGQPGPLVPAGRLLLLPMVALFVWVLDGLIGVLLYRRTVGRALSYAVWTAGILTSAVMWLAILQMLSTS